MKRRLGSVEKKRCNTRLGCSWSAGDGENVVTGLGQLFSEN